MQELQNGPLQGKEELIRQFALFTAGLHEKQILHIDYSSGNILYKKQGENYQFLLVDLNRMIFGKDITLEQGCYNLRKLYGNKEIISYVASEYAKARNFNQEECISLVLKSHSDFWTKIRKRHPEYRAYVD